MKSMPAKSVLKRLKRLKTFYLIPANVVAPVELFTMTVWFLGFTLKLKKKLMEELYISISTSSSVKSANFNSLWSLTLMEIIKNCYPSKNHQEITSF